jgi:hypothetical protein
MVGLGATAFLMGGEQQAPGPRVTPAVDTFLLQHAIVTGNVPVAPVATGSASPTAQRTATPGLRNVPVPLSGRRGAVATSSARSERSASSGPAASTPSVTRLRAGALVSVPPTAPADSGHPVPATTASSVAASATASPGP